MWSYFRNHTPPTTKKGTIAEHPITQDSSASALSRIGILQQHAPRVLTYVRKNGSIHPEQLTVFQSRDVLWVVVNGTTILNVYNDPQVTETITAITQWNVPLNTIVAGDMNAHLLHWRTDRPSTRRGTKLAEWAEKQGLLLLNEPDTDTTR